MVGIKGYHYYLQLFITSLVSMLFASFYVTFNIGKNAAIHVNI